MTMVTGLEALRLEIAALAGHKNSRRYPPELRARVAAFARDRRATGASIAAICAELDVGEPTMHRFLGLVGMPKRKKPVEGFKRVALAKPSSEPSRLVLRGPGGVVVEGLSVDEMAQLLKSLSCSA